MWRSSVKCRSHVCPCWSSTATALVVGGTSAYDLPFGHKQPSNPKDERIVQRGSHQPPPDQILCPLSDGYCLIHHTDVNHRPSDTPSPGIVQQDTVGSSSTN
jgi:hypothetical protein